MAYDHASPSRTSTPPAQAEPTSPARHYGEQLENIAATGEYHWMAGNYLRYAEAWPKEITPADMPVDSHELIALCAPRPVFIGGGTPKAVTAGLTSAAPSSPKSPPAPSTSSSARTTWAPPTSHPSAPPSSPAS